MGLTIENYSLAITELQRDILKKASLTIDAHEVVVLVGENGAGKSSFALSLMGLPGYEKDGSVSIGGQEVIDLPIDEVAKAGLFVSFQSPPEIEGVSLQEFIMTSYKFLHPDGLSTFKLRKTIKETAQSVGLNESFLDRSTNMGFSGGERRKSEVLQMLILDPKIAILDEVDSGLDIKSTQRIARLIRHKADTSDMGILVISHSPEFIRKLVPNRIIELRDKSFVEVSLEQIEQIVEE